MDHPVEIVFRNMRPSSEIEGLIREHMARLEKLFDGIVWCRVSIEIPNRREKTGDVPQVHIELHVPGQTLVVRRERHAKERHQKPNVSSAVHDAFESAAMKLRSYKQRLKRVVKPHPTPLAARVSNLRRDRGFGFITTSEGKELYFHRNSVMNGGFEALNDGDAVQYIEADGDTGPTASKVWRATNGRT